MPETPESQQDYRRALYWALRTRVLTTEEMAAVEAMDYYITVEPCVAYYEADKRREFGDALLNQFKMRTLKEQNK